MKQIEYNIRDIQTVAFASVLALGAILVAPTTAISGDAKSQAPIEAAEESIDEFVKWAEEQAGKMKAETDEVTLDAVGLGAAVSDAVKREWAEARAVIDRQQEMVADEIKGIRKASKSEWKDAKKIATQTISTLGTKVAEFRKSVMERDNADHGGIPDKKSRNATGVTDTMEGTLRDRTRFQKGVKTSLPSNITD